jgi:hypothetical protein
MGNKIGHFQVFVKFSLFMNMHPAALKLFHECGQTGRIKELTIKISTFKTEHTPAELLQLLSCTPAMFSIKIAPCMIRNTVIV